MVEFTVAKPTGEELGYMDDVNLVDVDIGDTNDFEFKINQNVWSREQYWYDYRIFITNTEYGGIIEDLETSTSTGEIIFRGPSWRGMLQRKIVEPPEGQSHLILSGELNNILRTLIEDRFDGLFLVPDISTEIYVENWQVDRYVSLYDALIKLLDTYNQRLQISYIEPEDLSYGHVSIQAVPITDYSDELEYSQDSKVNLMIRDYRGGYNHLVCIGEGENEERVVLHLYVQNDGSIGKTQYYFGLQERAQVYEYNSADLAKLEEDGAKRLKELQNYKKCEVQVAEGDLEIGDIVAGYDEVTDTSVKKPIIGKIFTMDNGTIKIEYKVKGDD